jgi:hypothetical protein
MWELDSEYFDVTMPSREPIFHLFDKSTGITYRVHTNHGSILDADNIVEAMV